MKRQAQAKGRRWDSKWIWTGAIGMVLALGAGPAVPAARAQAVAATNLPPVAQVQDFTWATNADHTVTLVRYIGFGGHVIIPGLVENLPVVRIGASAFENCRSLTNIAIPDSVTIIEDRAFSNCSLLQTAWLGAGVVHIGAAAFDYCKKLNAVLLPDSVVAIGERAFAYCSSLANLTIGHGVRSIGDQAFFYCWGLRSVAIPDSVGSIGDQAFYVCSGLGTLSVGHGVRTIGDEAFAYCAGLSHLVLGNSVASIGQGAFLACTNLVDITFPAATTRIGDDAFQQCGQLTGVYFHGNAPAIGARLFDRSNQAVIYYVHGTTGWGKTFGERPTVPWTPAPPPPADATPPPAYTGVNYWPVAPGSGLNAVVRSHHSSRSARSSKYQVNTSAGGQGLHPRHG